LLTAFDSSSDSDEHDVPMQSGSLSIVPFIDGKLSLVKVTVGKLSCVANNEGILPTVVEACESVSSLQHPPETPSSHFLSESNPMAAPERVTLNDVCRRAVFWRAVGP
jgi:hypothetical protein